MEDFHVSWRILHSVCNSVSNTKLMCVHIGCCVVLLLMVISCNSNIPALEEMQALLYHSENALLIGCLNKKLVTVDLAFGSITGEVPVAWMHGVLSCPCC